MLDTSPRRLTAVLAIVTAATAAVIAASITPAAAQTGGFDDLPAGAELSAAVERLAPDVLTGCNEFGGFSDDKFCPSESIDRKTMAVWIVRILDGQDPPPGSSRFPDVNSQLPVFWPPFIERLAELGVTQGCGDGTNFCPNDPRDPKPDGRLPHPRLQPTRRPRSRVFRRARRRLVLPRGSRVGRVGHHKRMRQRQQVLPRPGHDPSADGQVPLSRPTSGLHRWEPGVTLILRRCLAKAPMWARFPMT